MYGEVWLTVASSHVRFAREKYHASFPLFSKVPLSLSFFLSLSLFLSLYHACARSLARSLSLSLFSKVLFLIPRLFLSLPFSLSFFEVCRPIPTPVMRWNRHVRPDIVSSGRDFG